MAEALQALRASYNVAPTQTVPIIVEGRTTGTPTVMDARWGLVPSWWKELKPPTNTINARSEEAAIKPMWRHSWQHMRCLIPATHWYEWQVLQTGGKLPYAFTKSDGDGFMFAGLWSVWKNPTTGNEEPSCAILTRSAAPNLSKFHDRMPVILAPQVWRNWIDRHLTEPRTVKDILVANSMIDVRPYPVSARVNTPRNNDASLIDPASDQL